MVTIFKALALVPIGYALDWGVYHMIAFDGHNNNFYGSDSPIHESPFFGLLGIVVFIVMIIRCCIDFMYDYPAWLYIIAFISGMIIYGVKKFIKEFWYLWRKPRE